MFITRYELQTFWNQTGEREREDEEQQNETPFANYTFKIERERKE